MTTSSAALVTPVILTLNEEPNIERTLRSVEWADQVVVVDSGSTDETERIARRFANVRWLVRPFDTHASQWAFAIESAGTRTPYVLALDADYQVPGEFVTELTAHLATGEYAGAIAGFDYRIDGRSLLGSVYPPKLVVFRPDRVRVSQPGHTQELHVDGPVYRCATRLIHDDRKGLSRFVASQMEYARLESARLARDGTSRWQDRLRNLGIMPFIVGFGAYLKAGGPLRGTAALRYAHERALFECLLALRLSHDTSLQGTAHCRADDGPDRAGPAIHPQHKTAEK